MADGAFAKAAAFEADRAVSLPVCVPVLTEPLLLRVAGSSVGGGFEWRSDKSQEWMEGEEDTFLMVEREASLAVLSDRC